MKKLAALFLVLLVLSSANAGVLSDIGWGVETIVVGAVGAVAALIALTAVGFTSAGIAAGSCAAGMMSSAAIANGGGVVAGGVVATLQAAGAAGYVAPIVGWVAAVVAKAFL
ncbi:interferon alpha-inducible protein 27-like protein 2A isoform X1 [Strongylocentrotus purpuratus]|uniref:Uncharacterized protein n=1 Tax=Strongylocentrotus purpuratus TaxID=7668 RepID=A0A7M7P2K7_STRPU|nr:interferon alpha-inducible protein 27-like protein 2A isoform X1 [Strongylocentrotus purpuratus]XP_030844260.1 interferon alpha-inducible protein 27-like protein 2A isoform X1 [Strongylocentrotus purpuratus]XP_030844261.1 interferon alpha-inducible protein 27-like protein 2A isoform X2 [Strongylocentrotus purpuratus]XP_030844262.1 interferon alpha-inducible protein 27-like protein 2A isoform X1 [Strongylocentrotus purpuratus]